MRYELVKPLRGAVNALRAVKPLRGRVNALRAVKKVKSFLTPEGRAINSMGRSPMRDVGAYGIRPVSRRGNGVSPVSHVSPLSHDGDGVPRSGYAFIAVCDSAQSTGIPVFMRRYAAHGRRMIPGYRGLSPTAINTRALRAQPHHPARRTHVGAYGIRPVFRRKTMWITPGKRSAARGNSDTRTTGMSTDVGTHGRASLQPYPALRTGLSISHAYGMERQFAYNS